MLRPEPNEASIEAWLAGELSPEEAESIEQYFEEKEDHFEPEATEVEENLFKSLLIEADPEVVDMVARVKSGLHCEALAPGRDSWKEVLLESESPGLLGILGSYHVTEIVAMGGMAIVFKGYDPELRRYVALKVLAPEMAANATARERFLREARAAAQLEHENILSIFAVHDEAIPYFAMRFVDGGTLEDRLRAREAFSIEFLKRLTRQVCSALAAAHEKGIVHRDIKPANILISEDDQNIWVCDFGIARSMDDPSLTYPGAIAGTPKYMSPEQALGKEVDARSDLFSLGVVLYRCVAGKDLFSGETTIAVIGELNSEFAPKIPPGLKGAPKWLRRLLAWMLEEKPENRPQSSSEVLNAVEKEFVGRISSRHRRWKTLGKACGVSVAVLLLLTLAAQLPPVMKVINGVAFSNDETGIQIRGKFGVYPDLRSAIEVASAGDTLLLPSRVPVYLDQLGIKEGKSLCLVAANKRSRPILTTKAEGAAGIITWSNLEISGVDFHIKPKPDSDAIVIAVGAELKLSGCRFLARRRVLDPGKDVKSRAVGLQEGASLSMERCEFDVEETNAITIRGEGCSISMSDSEVNAYYAVDLIPGPSEVAPNRFEVNGSEFFVQALLHGTTANGGEGIRCRVEDSEISLFRALAWFSSSKVDRIDQYFQWEEKENRFPLAKGFVRVGQGEATVRGDVFLDPTGAGRDVLESPIGWVRVEGTDLEYQDLHKAIAEAPDGSCLLISGTVPIANDIETTKSVDLRGVPGTDPTLLILEEDGHGIFFFFPAKFQGLRVIRPRVAGNALPAIGFRVTEGDAVVEDCRFQINQNIPGNPVALSFTAGENGIVRNCVFEADCCIYVASDERGRSSQSVMVENCLFQGKTGFQLRALRGTGENRISLRDNLFLTDCLVEKNKLGELPVSIWEVRGNLFRVRKTLLSFPEVSSQRLDEAFRWEGFRNRYSPGGGGLVSNGSARVSLEELSGGLHEWFVSQGEDFVTIDEERIRDWLSTSGVRKEWLPDRGLKEL